MQVAAALSEHPLATHAVGETVGELLDVLGTAPQVAVVGVTRSHLGALEDIAAAVREILRPAVVVGVAASGVLHGSHVVDEGPGLVLWGVRAAGASPLRFGPGALPPGGRCRLPERPLPSTQSGGYILFGDPYSFDPAQELVSGALAAPDMAVAGGLLAGARGPGGSRLLLGDQLFTDGAVGFRLEHAVLELADLPGPGLHSTIGSPMRPAAGGFAFCSCGRSHSFLSDSPGDRHEALGLADGRSLAGVATTSAFVSPGAGKLAMGSCKLAILRDAATAP